MGKSLLTQPGSHDGVFAGEGFSCLRTNGAPLDTTGDQRKQGRMCGRMAGWEGTNMRMEKTSVWKTYLLLKMVNFQLAMLVYWRVHRKFPLVHPVFLEYHIKILLFLDEVVKTKMMMASFLRNEISALFVRKQYFGHCICVDLMDLHSVILVFVVFVVEGDGDFGRCFAISAIGLSASGIEATVSGIICHWSGWLMRQALFVVSLS